MECFIERNLSTNAGLLRDGVVSIEYLSQSTYVGQIDDEHRKNGKGVYQYSNDDAYWGNWKNDNFHGDGVYHFSNGDVFKGVFENGQCLKGELVENSGDVYQGEFHEGRKNGFGRMQFRNGDSYEGFWRNDAMEGKGTYFTKQFRIIGNWKDSKAIDEIKIEGINFIFYGIIDSESELSGHINIRYPNGEMYQGSLIKSQRSGEGSYSFNLRQKYTGQFLNNRIHGRGRLQTIHGVYEGDFVNSLPHGHGKFISDSGDIYEGQWLRGEKEGRGTTLFRNGDIHEGSYREGLRQGQGKYTWKSASECYMGEFHADVCSGLRRCGRMDRNEGFFKDSNGMRVHNVGMRTGDNSQPPSPF